MTKLLHERLRDVDVFDDILLKKMHLAISESVADELADEIERCYIPRPRYEDGEPVQFGDETNMHEAIEAMLFEADGSFELQHKGKNKFGTNVAFYEPNEPVKRPSKVLDADGVEINVGDIVWWSEDTLFNPYTVTALHHDTQLVNHVKIQASDGGQEYGVHPSKLTHERPIFDADGVPICKGDTVYVSEKYRDRCSRAWYDEDGMFFGLKGYEFGHPVTVSSMSDRDGYSQVYFIRGGCNCPNLALTHREPDSLEQLLERMEDYAQKNEGYVDGSKVGDFSKELRALIERGA